MLDLNLMAVFARVVEAGSFAEAARRFGGGKSGGMQRQMAVPNKAPVAAPARPAAATPMTQNQPKRSWMGPIAGLAAGIKLALGCGSKFAVCQLQVEGPDRF